MTADALTATGTHPSSPPDWLAVSRKRAFLTHLALSATIVGVVCALIFFIWYPYPYFNAMGGWNVLRILIGVDLVLGPLLTLIVFKPGKPGLKFDLAFIGFVQLVALVYGLTTIYRERPYFTVYAIDRFIVVSKHDVDAQELAAAREAGRVADKPFRGPLLLAAAMPKDLETQQRILDETLFRGMPDIDRRPEFWQPFEDQAAIVLRAQKPLSTLRATHPDVAAAIDALSTKLGLPEKRLGYLPLIAKNRDVAFVVDAETGAPLDVIDVDPWGGGPRAPR
jgi:hypothetical protein